MSFIIINNQLAQSWFLVSFLFFILGYLVLLNFFLLVLIGSAGGWSTSLSSLSLNFYSFRLKNLGFFSIFSFLGLPPLFFFFNKIFFLSIIIKNLGLWSTISLGFLVFFIWAVYFKLLKIIFNNLSNTNNQPLRLKNPRVGYFFILTLVFLMLSGLSFFIEDFFTWVLWVSGA